NAMQVLNRGDEPRNGLAVQYEALLRDFRYALAHLRRRPAFVLVVTLSLGLGIGLNGAVFTWLKAVYLDPFPGVPHARRMVTINSAPRDGSGLGSSYDDYRYIRDHSHSLAGVIAHETESLSLGTDAQTIVEAGLVSENYFAMLRLPLIMGSGFVANDDVVS